MESDDMFAGPVTLYMLAWVRFNGPGELPQVTSVRIFSDSSPTSRLSHGAWIKLLEETQPSWEMAQTRLESALACWYPRLAHLYGRDDESIL